MFGRQSVCPSINEWYHFHSHSRSGHSAASGGGSCSWVCVEEACNLMDWSGISTWFFVCWPSFDWIVVHATRHSTRWTSRGSLVESEDLGLISGSLATHSLLV